jgi:ribosomal protein S18 acetylase RimI-like enzyme
MTTIDSTTVLDNAAWASLSGPHARFAEGFPPDGSAPVALRYPAEVSPFTAISDPADEAVWPALHRLAGHGQTIMLSGGPDLAGHLPAGWEIGEAGRGVQLVATDALVSGPAGEAVRLTTADVPEMIDLVERTKPGPFRRRTIELGTYLGIRRGGALVAMAGERLHPPGWTEISAVCTDPAHRGQGLASQLVRALAHGIRERGEVPLMHASAGNVTAIRLYESLGFSLRTYRSFFALRTPVTEPR